MIIGWILISFQLWFGFESVSRFLRKKFDPWIKIAMAVPVGFLLSSLVFFIGSLFLGANIFHAFVHMLLLGFCSAVLYVTRKKSKWANIERPTKLQFSALVLASIISVTTVPHFYFPKPFILNSVCFSRTDFAGSFW